MMANTTVEKAAPTTEVLGIFQNQAASSLRPLGVAMAISIVVILAICAAVLFVYLYMREFPAQNLVDDGDDDNDDANMVEATHRKFQISAKTSNWADIHHQA